MKKILLFICFLLYFYVNNSAQIYIVGHEYSDYDTTSSHDYYSTIKYWKNDVSYTLFNAENHVRASDIFVSDTNIYIIGNEMDTTYFGRGRGYLWHNGTKQSLTDSTQWSNAYSIVVANGDIYITGTVQNSSSIQNKSVATFWKNGIAQHLEPDSIFTAATALFVENNNIYIIVVRSYWATQTQSYTVGTVWKNGEKLYTIGDGATYSCQFYDMYVVNDDVYIAGYMQPENWSDVSRAVVWKNGIPEYLTDDYSPNMPIASAVCVKDSDIYVAGRAYFSVETGVTAVVWKNGELMLSYFPADYVTDFAVVGNDIYVITSTENLVYVWKNEDCIYAYFSQDLPYMEATAIFVNPDSLPNIGIPQAAGQPAAVKLYPNPANSYITIELPAEIPDAELQLFDMQGRQLKQEKITTKSILDISRLQSGFYLYKVVSKQQQYNGKLLITR